MQENLKKLTLESQTLHMKQINKLLFAVIFFLYSAISFANEGMWLPFLLEKLNEKEMKNLGMKISAKDIYSINS